MTEGALPEENGYELAAKALGMPAPRPKLRVVKDEETTTTTESTGVWRPSNLGEYVGQQRAQVKLKLHVTAALKQGKQPGHLMVSGPPGLGKTSLSAIVAALINERRPEGEHVAFHQTMGETVKSQKSLAKALGKIRAGDVLFIDECHRLGEKAEECLGLAMEDNKVTVSSAENADPVPMVIPPFTLVLATTKPADLSQPLRDRCKLAIRMEWYSEKELTEIVENAAARDSVTVTNEAALAIAQVGRQTPRITLGIFDQVVAFAVTINKDVIEPWVTKKAFDVIGLDSLGLDERDRDYMTIVASWQGRRVGLAPAAAKSGLDTKEICDEIEPYMLRAGLLDRSSRGRCLTKRTYEHLWPDQPIPPLLGLS